jgi:FlaA1/EpsC-like NDP-sugar epimerase
LIESNEFALYKIHSELKNILNSNELKKKIEIFSFLGSVQDNYFLERVYGKYKPETVFHVAAYKHVSLVEKNPIESIKNNVFGSLNIYLSSIKHNCSDLVLVSTDKAVRPKSLMGATKRLSELCLQALYKEHSDKIKMSMVRFGNALDSSGSVIPLFKKQIHDGGPITLTHKDVTRYFMTIPEAAQLVIQASSLAEGGEVFVLEMGKPVKIIDLAKRMIKLSGLTLKDASNLNGVIEIKEIGLAPGEKLHEELLLGEDPQLTSHLKIKKAKDPFILWSVLKQDIETLKKFSDNNNFNSAIKIIKKIVPGY